MLREKTKNLLVRLTSRHSRTVCRPPIFLFATRRSGSTWLSEILLNDSNLKLQDQPFDFSRNALARAKLPFEPGARLVGLSKREREQVRAYMGRLLTGKSLASPSWWFWTTEYSTHYHRWLFKLCNAHWLQTWLNDTFYSDSVVLLRHPVATAESMRRRGWDSLFRQYVARCDELFGRRLGRKKWLRVKSLVDDNGGIIPYVAEWCCDNYPFIVKLQNSKRREWELVFYEDLVLRGQRTVKRIADSLELEVSVDNELLTRQSRTANTGLVLTRSGERDEGGAILKKWKDTIGKDDIGTIQKILDLFSVRLYTTSCAVPQLEERSH